MPIDNISASDSSAARCLRLLSIIATGGKALNLATLTDELQLPKATVHRLCMQLVESRFLSRGVEERSYSVGPSLRQLAFNTLNHDVVRGLRHDVLTGLVSVVGETCNFTTIDGTQILYLDRVEAKWPLRLSLEIGSHVPIHCTASGKMLLASMPTAQRHKIIEQLNLHAATEQTITQISSLKAECKVIAKQGFACDREEFIAGLIAVAVPVFDLDGCAKAALAIHAPTTRMSLNDAQKLIPHLIDAAKKMSALL
jgi:IclR family transcriptional regulator, acetate operon repressor